MTKRYKVLLAGSGGGHVRQILDLQPFWEGKNYRFVTENTALGRSLADRHPVDFVSHYALGQARLGRPGQMIWAGLKNLMESLRIILRERPDVVITTGAGAVYFVAMFSKLLGARLILIDSFARFDRPSKFARMVKPWADEVIVQSAALKQIWPSALLFDPFKILDEEAPSKQNLLFATVGATLGFERLVSTVVALKASGRLPEHVILQVGEGEAIPADLPDGVEVFATLSFDEIQETVRKADFVVTHGGTGSLITALRAGCRTVAIPRRFSLGEHYDDHQEEITAAFEARGLIQVADNPEELFVAIEKLRATPVKMATTNPEALIAHLNTMIGMA